MANNYPKPSSYWPAYGDELLTPAFHPDDFAELTKHWEERLKTQQVDQNSNHPKPKRVALSLALQAVAKLKEKQLFDHFGIDQNSNGKWQALALSLAAHHVPGCAPKKTGSNVPPKLNRTRVLEVYWAWDIERKRLRSKGVEPAQARYRAASTVTARVGKEWPEFSDMGAATLERRYYEVTASAQLLPSISDYKIPRRKGRSPKAAK